MRLRIVTLACAIAVLLNACVARKMAMLYPPPERPTNEIAIVTGVDDMNGAVFIESVDGEELNDQPWESFNPFFGRRVNDLQLLPGPHILEVQWIRGKGGRSIESIALKLDAVAGHRYKIFAYDMPPETVWKRIALFTVGGRSTWTAWVTDDSSGAVVAGMRSPDF